MTVLPHDVCGAQKATDEATDEVLGFKHVFLL